MTGGELITVACRNAMSPPVLKSVDYYRCTPGAFSWFLIKNLEILSESLVDALSLWSDGLSHKKTLGIIVIFVIEKAIISLAVELNRYNIKINK